MEDLEHFKQKLGQKIKTLRVERGLTQPQLGDLVGIDYQAISRIERGLVNPSAYLIKNFSEALKVTPGELYSFD